MSIILTAGKRAVKPKSAKPKKKRSAQAAAFDPTPPLSSRKTSVWYWKLDGVPTTVMLSKDNNEVWCNGVVLSTIDGFAEDDGGAIDFTIYVEETDVEHKARIKRLASGSSHEGIVHQLFVDGCLVQEHTSSTHQELQRAASATDDLSEEAEAFEDGFTSFTVGYENGYSYGAPPEPPCYEEAIAQGGYYEDDGYDNTNNMDQSGYGGYDQAGDYDYVAGYTDTAQDQNEKKQQ